MTITEIYNHFLDYSPKALSVVKDCVLLGTAITGSVVAVKGLGTWRRQINGQSNYNLSKNLLVSLFKYRDAINMVRNPFMSSQEMPLPPIDEREKMGEEDIRFYGTYKAYEKRWEEVGKLQAEIYANLIEAEALWGNDLSSMWQQVKRKESELLMQLQNYINLCNPKTSLYEKERLQANQLKMHDALYDGGEEDVFKIDFESKLLLMTNHIKEKIKH